MSLKYFSDRPMPKLYVEPTPAATTKNEPGMFGNLGRAFGSGALSGLGGIFDFVGAEGIAKQLYGWSDDARASMSAEAQQDMAKSFFAENDQGETIFGDGLTDLDTWLLTFANVAGQFVPTAVPGAGLAGAASKALTLGAKGTNVARAAAFGLTGGASATGQGMEQARQEFLTLPDEVKMESDLFRRKVQEIATKSPELDDMDIWTNAEKAVADQIAQDVRTDPKVLLANFAGSALADPVIGKALTGARIAKSGAFRSALKGFVTEGSTEAGQAAVQEYGINEALSKVDGRDAWDGVGIAALNEGLAGGAFGAGAGLLGGFANRQQPEVPVRDKDADAIRESNSALAGAFDSLAQDSQNRQVAIYQAANTLPAVSSPALEGELLGPEVPEQRQYNPNQIGMQPRIGGPTVPRIEQKDIIFAADGRDPYDVFREQQAQQAPAIEKKDIIFAPDNTGVKVDHRTRRPFGSEDAALKSKTARQMRADGLNPTAVQFGDGWGLVLGPQLLDSPVYEGEYISAAEERAMMDKANADYRPRIGQSDVIFATDRTDELNAAERQQRAEAFSDNLVREARNTAANQAPRLPQKDIIFAGDGRAEQARQEFSQNLQNEAERDAAIPRLPQKDIIFAPDNSGVRVKGNGEVYKSPREAVTSKQARIAKRTGVEVEAVQFGDGWGWRVKDAAPAQADVKPLTLKGGSSASIEIEPSPKAFSPLVRMEHGEPIAIVARSDDGVEIGRLTYMPNGGPIDVFVNEGFRRQGVATALYDELEKRGGKVPSMSSGVAISSDAEAFRANRARSKSAQVQVKKSGDPFKSEKEMKASVSFKTAAENGAEIETVKVDGGFGFRVVAKKPESLAQDAVPTVAPDLSGEPLSKEWTSFSDDSGTLKIPRAEMPQIKSEHRGAMTQFFKARGIEHEQDMVPSSELKPTQAEFSPTKVTKAMDFDGGERSILVSSDGYVLDGHHQWLAKREKGEQVNVIRFNAPIGELVKLAHEFPSSTTAIESNSQKAESSAALTGSSPELPPIADIKNGETESGVNQNDIDPIDKLAEPLYSEQQEADTPQMDIADFTVESDANSVKVYGDTVTIRQKLRSVGINFDGAEIEGGLSFGKKLESRIRPVFENAEPPTGVALSVGKSSNGISAEPDLPQSYSQPEVMEPASVIDETATGNAAPALPAILKTTKKKYIAQQVKLQKLKESSPGYAKAVARLEEQYEADIDRAQAGLAFEQFNALNDDSPESVNRQAYKALREEFGLPTEPEGGEYEEKPKQVRHPDLVSGSGSPALDSDVKLQEADEVGNQPISFSRAVNKPDADAYRSALEKSLKSLRSNPEPIRIGKTPDVMVRFGAPELDLYVRKDTVIKATNKVKDDHDVPMSVIEQLPELMADPIAVLDDSGKSSAQVLIIDAVTESGKTIGVAVHLESNEGRMTVNRIASVYGKGNYGRMKLQYFNENKNPALVRLIRPQLPLSGSPSRGSEQNVLTKEDLVKENPDIQFSNQNTIDTKPPRGVSMETARAEAADILRKLNGAAGIKIEVLATQADAEKLWNMSLEDSMVRGAFNGQTKTAYIIAENIRSIEELRQTIAHEVIGHGGLQSVIGAERYAEFIERLIQTRKNNAFKSLWARIDRDYDDFDVSAEQLERIKAEEVFAYFVQNKPVNGPIKFWWNAFKRYVQKLLSSVGLMRPEDADIAVMKDMLESIRAGFAAGGKGTGKGRADMAYSRTTEQAEALDKLGLGEQIAESISDKAKQRVTETIDTLKSQSFWQRLNEGIFDGLAGIKQAEEAVGVVDPNKQGYVSARLASGLSDILHGVFHYGAPEWRDGVVQRKADTKGLLEVFGMLGDDLNDWLAWMGANRAERLMAEGRENNLTKADIDELKALAAGKEQLFEEVRQEYNKINSAIIDLAEDAGLLNAEQRSGFDEEWYVPFFRDMEEEVDPEMAGIAAMVHGPRSRKGIAGQSAQIKELKGGRQSTKDLLENIIQRQSTMIDAAIKNKAMAEVVGNLEGSPFMQAVESPEIAALSQTELNLLQKVKVMRNGKAEAYTVTDPALLRGLLQIHTIGNNSLFNRFARGAKRYLTAGITLSPDFIVKNFVRDAAHAWMINKDGFRFGADSVKGLRKAFTEDESYRDLIFSGAAFQGGYVHGADPEAAAQQIRRALRSKGLTNEQVTSYMDSLITKGSKLFEAYRTASDKVENANRLSTYEAALSAGKSRRQAAFEAKDLMDYSLKGNFAMIGNMIDMLPFFNARLQGMSKLVRSMKGADGDRVLKVLSANLAMKGLKIAAFSLALAALNDDDERYQELPDWDKDANWHFFIGDDHYRIPKPFELGIIFGTMPERMFHYAAGSQPGSDMGKAAAHAVWNTLALNPIPQLALPVIEVLTNKSFFKGSAIEGMGDEQRQPEDRYNAYTSETAKQIGAAFGASPKMVEHLILGYTGTLGGYVLSVSDAVARQMLGVTSADTPISRYPVIKAFYQGDAPKTATKFQDEFYKAIEQANEAYGSYKRAVEEGDVVRQQDLKQDESQALGARIQLTRIQRQINELSKQADRVNNNQELTGAEKRERLDEITRRKNELYQSSYVRFKIGEW